MDMLSTTFDALVEDRFDPGEKTADTDAPIRRGGPRAFGVESLFETLDIAASVYEPVLERSIAGS